MSLGRRVSERLRGARPERVVTRHVQGVDLVLPWSHRLPDYAEQYPEYGQNLVAVAGAVAQADRAPFVMVDIGANVGDSALQVLASSVDARVLCVEGDPYWLDFLHRNVDRVPRVRVVPALVLPDDASTAVVPDRHHGTTRFVEATADSTDASSAVVTVSPDDLRRDHEDLGRVRLVKSDTDGYDARIVPAVARAFADTRPVLFFEYDPGMSRGVGDDEPERVWSTLADLGYDRVTVWDNFGEALGVVAIDAAAAAAAVLDRPFEERGHHYWDVAVTHRDDRETGDLLAALVGAGGLGPGPEA